MSRTVHVVPTSHWDREWYLPFERFRAWLVAALDGPRTRWLISSHDDYFAALEPALTRELPTFQGELRGARDAPLLSGTLSARLYLKQRNFRLESLLTRWVEPAALFARLAVMAAQFGLAAAAIFSGMFAIGKLLLAEPGVGVTLALLSGVCWLLLHRALRATSLV